MARPPIVISNGGIASKLTDGLIVATDPITEEQKIAAVAHITNNIDSLNGQTGLDSPVAKSLSGSNKLNEPRIYWRLEGDDEYQKQGSKAKEIGLEAQ